MNPTLQLIGSLILAALGWCLVALAVRQVNAMGPGAKGRWLKAPLWALVGALGLLLGIRPVAAADGTLRYKVSDGSTIELTAERGPCVGDARLAHYTSADMKTKVPGCYRLRGGSVVTLSWLDGDSDRVPARSFRPVEGL